MLSDKDGDIDKIVAYITSTADFGVSAAIEHVALSQPRNWVFVLCDVRRRINKLFSNKHLKLGFDFDLISMLNHIYNARDEIADKRIVFIATYYLGKCSEFGLGHGLEDKALAFRYYTEAFQLVREPSARLGWGDYSNFCYSGNIEALRRLADVFLDSEYSFRDPDSAKELFNAVGTYLIYFNKLDLAKQKGIEYYRVAAEDYGNCEALANLGDLYTKGLSLSTEAKLIQKNHSKAIDYYCRALWGRELIHISDESVIAKLKNILRENRISVINRNCDSIPAYATLAMCALEERGGQKSESYWQEYLTTSANLDYKKAQYYLAQTYLSQDKKFEEAAIWYQRAVKGRQEKGDGREAVQYLKRYVDTYPVSEKNACLFYAYAICLEHGHLPDKEDRLASYFFSQALQIDLLALNKDTIHQRLLAAKESPAGFKYIEELAKANPHKAICQILYATCLQYGYGTRKDIDAAKKHVESTAALPDIAISEDILSLFTNAELLPANNNLIMYFLMLRHLQAGPWQDYYQAANYALHILKYSSISDDINHSVQTALAAVTSRLVEQIDGEGSANQATSLLEQVIKLADANIYDGLFAGFLALAYLAPGHEQSTKKFVHYALNALKKHSLHVELKAQLLTQLELLIKKDNCPIDIFIRIFKYYLEDTKTAGKEPGKSIPSTAIQALHKLCHQHKNSKDSEYAPLLEVLAEYYQQVADYPPSYIPQEIQQYTFLLDFQDPSTGNTFLHYLLINLDDLLKHSPYTPVSSAIKAVLDADTGNLLTIKNNDGKTALDLVSQPALKDLLVTHAKSLAENPDTCQSDIFHLLGNYYAQQADLGKHNVKKAAEYFIAAAKKGPDGFKQLVKMAEKKENAFIYLSAQAACVFEGWGTPVNRGNALAVFKIVVESKCCSDDEKEIAEYYLARAYETGERGYKKDLGLALIYYTNIIKRDNPSEYWGKKAFEKLSKSLIPEVQFRYKLENMTPEMLNALAYCHFYAPKYFGADVAIIYMEHSYVRGDRVAAYLLGRLYESLNNYSSATGYYTEALQTRELPPTEAKKAFAQLDALLKKFPSESTPDVKVIQAMCYYYGHGVAQNTEIGRKTLAELSQYNSKAAYFYGIALEEEINVQEEASINAVASAYYFSARNNNTDTIGSVGAANKLKNLVEKIGIASLPSLAAYNYADCLTQGYGELSQDPLEAKKYYMHAARNDRKCAAMVCSLYRKKAVVLTTEELIESFNKVLKYSDRFSTLANDCIQDVRHIISAKSYDINKAKASLALNIALVQGAYNKEPYAIDRDWSSVIGFFKDLQVTNPGLANFYLGHLHRYALSQDNVNYRAVISYYFSALKEDDLPAEYAKEIWGFFTKFELPPAHHYAINNALGMCYYAGWHVEKNYEKALVDLIRAIYDTPYDDIESSQMIMCNLGIVYTDAEEYYPNKQLGFSDGAKWFWEALSYNTPAAGSFHPRNWLQRLCKKYRNSDDDQHKPLFEVLMRYYRKVIDDSPEEIDQIINEECFQPDIQDPDTGNTLLHLLVLRVNNTSHKEQKVFDGLMNIIQKLVRDSGGLLTMRNTDGYSPIDLAASTVLRNFLLMYAEKYGKLKPEFYRASLYHALLAGNFEEADRLLDKGARPDHLTDTNNSIFHMLAANPSLDAEATEKYFIFIDKWLKKDPGAKDVLKGVLYCKNGNQHSALDIAINNERHDMVSALFNRLVGDETTADEMSCQLGAIYNFSHTPNVEKAAYYYRQSAKYKTNNENGSLKAFSCLETLAADETSITDVLYNLGLCYEFGYGTERSQCQAENAYRKVVDACLDRAVNINFQESELFDYVSSNYLVGCINADDFNKASKLIKINASLNCHHPVTQDNILHLLVIKANAALDAYVGSEDMLNLPELQLLQTLLSNINAKNLIFQKNSDGQAPIALARYTIISSLFAEAYQTDATDTAQYSRALQLALVKKDLVVAKSLVAAGAPMACTDKEGNNPFHVLAKNPDSDIKGEITFCITALSVLSTIKKSIVVDEAFAAQFILEKNDAEKTPLDIAVEHGNQYFIDAFSNILGWDRLQMYIYCNKPELTKQEMAIQFSLEQKGKANAKKDNLDLSLFRLARSLKHWECLLALLPEKGPLSDSEKYQLGEILPWAIFENKVDIVERLLTLGVITNWQPDPENPTHDPALHLAVRLKQIDTLKLLLQHIASGKIDANQLSGAGETLLEVVIKTNDQVIFDTVKPYIQPQAIKIGNKNKDEKTVVQVANELYEKGEYQQFLSDAKVIESLTLLENTEKDKFKRAAVGLFADMRRGITSIFKPKNEEPQDSMFQL